MQFSYFANRHADKPSKNLTLDDFIAQIQEGEWRTTVMKLRGVRENDRLFKSQKLRLPAVTVSGVFKNRDKKLSTEEKLQKHSGLICIDIDAKDNPKMRVRDLVDKDAIAQFVSCSGAGVKLIYKCKAVKTKAEHRRIYDAVMLRLQKKNFKLKPDPIVKSIANLQYVSYDPEAFYNPKTKLVVQPLAPVKLPKVKPSKDHDKDLRQLDEYVNALGNRDVTKNYEDWLLVAFGLSYTLGERGREAFHRISSNYKGYSEEECNEKYDACMENNLQEVEKPVTIATVYQILTQHIHKPTLKQLARKYNKSHAVGVGEDVEHGDLAGMVRYKLFLFKKVFDKESNTLVELVPATINLNAFETLLKEKGFHRFGKMYIWIQNNVVEEVDVDDVLRIITQHVEADGDYAFTYKKLEFRFSWEELAHLWRTIRAHSATYNQVSSSLTHWVPNILTDTATHSYIPYRNGVVEVTAKGQKILPYTTIVQQVWKERILPREFTYTPRAGMFEHFFANVCGRGKVRHKSPEYLRALWYFGYMLHGSKRQSTARAWLLYDIRTGNNGRSGKTILGQAVGHVRSMVTIDGKQVDLRNRFAFQTVQPWTNVLFIDDPSKYTSLNPFFNIISGQLYADRKNQDPVQVSIKVMIASNWILESEGRSESGRQFVTQLDDFYERYSKEHKNTITPVVDLHGKEFFTDWSPGDWSQFDSFCVRALVAHLKNSAPANTIIGNSAVIRFTQVHEHELYYQLAQAFRDNAKEVDGGVAIQMQTLTELVKDSDPKLTGNAAGRIAREFLNAISGGCTPTISTARVGGRVYMVYKLAVKMSAINLDFGQK